jgi:molybdopterin-guanine dinucleotide biosynthesis protein A
MRVGGILLCGGQSLRMGEPKAWLPFGDELLLPRVARIVSEAVQPIVVVAAQCQTLPACPGEPLIVRDEYPDRGPLEGLRAGLKALAPLVEAAYVTSVDVPLLLPAFVRHMIAQLGEADVAVPVEMTSERRFYHPLAGVYRTRVLPAVERLLAADQLRLNRLFDAVPTNAVPIETLRTVDPELAGLRNLNTPDDYQAALVAAGLKLEG